jgi:hypothetical protein
MTLLQQDHGSGVITLIREAYMKAGDFFLIADRGGMAIYFQAGLSPRIVEDFDVPPSDAPAHAQAEGFGKGLFGTKAKGKGSGGISPFKAEFSLLFRENPVYETLTPALQHCLNPGNVNEIDSDAVNHKKTRIQKTEFRSQEPGEETSTYNPQPRTRLKAETLPA